MDKTPHPHAAMFKEWIDDTSRNIEYQVRGNEIWSSYTDDIYYEIERFDPVCNWRFSDTVTKAPVVKSGLTHTRMRELFKNFCDSCSMSQPSGSTLPFWEILADAAAQEIVTRIMGLDAVTRLDDEVSGGGYSRIQVIAFMNQAIKHFLENLPSALEKTK